MIDHRDLLKRYIDHVGQCEGVTYLSDHALGIGDHSMWGDKGPPVKFTSEEVAELRRLSAEDPLLNRDNFAVVNDQPLTAELVDTIQVDVSVPK
jgi:hypothetical protein